MRGALQLAGAAALVFCLLGCEAPVASGLSDAEANRVVLALDHALILATKEPDAAEGRYRIAVAREDLPRALRTLAEEELPRPTRQGVLDAVGRGSVLPSEASEHAQFVAATASELAQSLEGITGVVRARVHLSLPLRGPLEDRAQVSRGSASVLVEHRGPTPPLSADDVARLVAGAAAGLVPADVHVVFSPRPAAANTQGTMASLGPVTVPRSALRPLQVSFAGLLLLVMLFAGATLFLYLKWSKLRESSERAAGAA